MPDIDLDADTTLALTERRWFASQRAVRRMQEEVDMLREVVELAEASWRTARQRLEELATLRDALAAQLEWSAPARRSSEVGVRAGNRALSSAA